MSGPLIVDYSEVFGQRVRQFGAGNRRGPLLLLSKPEKSDQLSLPPQDDEVFSVAQSVDAVQFVFDLTKDQNSKNYEIYNHFSNTPHLITM